MTCQPCGLPILENESRVCEWNGGNVRYVHRACSTESSAVPLPALTSCRACDAFETCTWKTEDTARRSCLLFNPRRS